MKDNRPMNIRYAELKIKMTRDLDQTKTTSASLLKDAAEASNEPDRLFFKRWSDCLKAMIPAMEKSLLDIERWIEENSNEKKQ